MGLCLVAIFFCGLLGATASGVELVAPAPQTAQPGEFVTLVFTVWNGGSSQAVDLRLEAEAPSALTLVGVAPPELRLEPGAKESAFVTVYVPQEAQPGQQEIVLRVRGADGLAVAVGIAQLNVVLGPRVEIFSPEERQARPAEQLVYNFGVALQGSEATLEFHALSARGYAVSVRPARASLGPGARLEVYVTLAVPPTAVPGRDLLLFRVFLRGESESRPVAETQLVTTILPWTYTDVPSFLGLELPLLLSLSAGIEPLTPPIFHRVTAEALMATELADGILLRSGLAGSLLPAVALGAGFLSLGLGGVPRSMEPSLEFVSLPGERRLLLGVHGFELGLAASRDGARHALQAGVRLPHTALAAAYLLDAKASRSIFDFGGTTRASIGALLWELRWETAMALSADLSGMEGADGAYRLSLGVSPSWGELDLEFRRAGAFWGDEIAFQAGLSLPFPLALASGSQADLQLSFQQTQEPATTTSGLVGSFSLTHEPFRVGAGWLGELLAGSGAAPQLRSEWAIELIISAQPLFAVLSAQQESSRSRLGLMLQLRGNPQLTARLFWEGHGLGLAFGFGWSTAQIGLIEAALVAEEPRVSLSLSVHVPLTIPLETIPVRGRVEGVVFEDRNGNGRPDGDEPGVAELLLALDGMFAQSDPRGRFRFPPLFPGRYRLQWAEPPEFVAGLFPLPLELAVERGRVTTVALPVRRVSAIFGRVFHDIDRDGRRDAGEGGIGGVRLWLVGEGRTEAGVTGPGGTVVFRVPPGRYRLGLDVATLPRGHASTGPMEIEIQLPPEKAMSVEFGVVPQPRPIKLAPVAEFRFEPAQPRVGEPVRFDASPSYDPDGVITKYEWDLDGDGGIDAEGKTITHAFSNPGQVSVMLVVTDDGGLQDRATKTLVVER